MKTKCPEKYTIEINGKKLVFECGKHGKHRYHKANHGLRGQIEWLSEEDFSNAMMTLAGIKRESK